MREQGVYKTEGTFTGGDAFTHARIAITPSTDFASEERGGRFQRKKRQLGFIGGALGYTLLTWIAPR